MLLIQFPTVINVSTTLMCYVIFLSKKKFVVLMSFIIIIILVMMKENKKNVRINMSFVNDLHRLYLEL